MTGVYGETWVYESLVGAVPGVDVPPGWAVAIQVLLFESAVLGLGWYYGLPVVAIVAGTVAVAVAGVGSAVMLWTGEGYRRLDAPPAYRRLLFGTRIEVVLAVVAFTGLLTYLFVAELGGGTGLLSRLFGSVPPAAVVFVTLLVLWDLCYRIGVSWWTAVVSLWRAVAVDLGAADTASARRLDAVNAGYAAAQLSLVPFLQGEPVLLAAVIGHVAAVLLVSAVAAAVA